MQRMLKIVESDKSQTLYMPPNEQMLAIALLYLQKYELLATEDKALFRKCIEGFHGGVGRWFENSEIEETTAI